MERLRPCRGIRIQAPDITVGGVGRIVAPCPTGGFERRECFVPRFEENGTWWANNPSNDGTETSSSRLLVCPRLLPAVSFAIVLPGYGVGAKRPRPPSPMMDMEAAVAPMVLTDAECFYGSTFPAGESPAWSRRTLPQLAALRIASLARSNTAATGPAA